jgi:hypothetical protein
MHPAPTHPRRLGRRSAAGLAGALVTVVGLTALAGPAQAAPSSAAPAPCAAAADAVPLGERAFDARTGYATATGTIDWTSNWFHVRGKLKDAATASSTSYAYVHWSTKNTQGCSVWIDHEARAATAGNGKTVNINLDRGPYSDQQIANVWVETCTSHNGWTCSGWK